MNSKPEANNLRLYCLLLVLPIVLISITLALTAIWLKPAGGDLTRISIYSDRDFQPTQSESLLNTSNVKIIRAPINQANNWEVKGDLLIFGDSFAFERATTTWIDLIEQSTGLTIHQAPLIDWAQVKQYLQSESFANAPPKGIIVQSVERHIRTRALSFGEELKNQPCAQLPGKLSQQRKVIAPIEANQTFELIKRENRYTSVEQFYERAVIFYRKLLKPKESPVIKAKLSRSDLFSNPEPDQILLYREDVDKHVWAEPNSPEADATSKTIVCNSAQLAHLAREVPFRFLWVPDKRTIYQPWIQTELAPKAVDFEKLTQSPLLKEASINLFKELNDAVLDGQKDVYEPNDSHWGLNGHVAASNAVIKSLFDNRPALGLKLQLGEKLTFNEILTTSP